MKTSQKQILKNGEEKSTSSQGDFLASLSLSQVRERERMITVTSGHKCSEQYKKFNPLGLLVKMLLESSRWFSPVRRLKWQMDTLSSRKITEKEYCYDKNMSSKPSAKILSERDIPSNRCLFRLVPSEPHTEETGCGLLPTVQTQGLKMCDENGKTQFYPMELLPTPTSMDSGSGKINRSLTPEAKERPTIALAAKMGLLPSPVASDAAAGAIIGKNDVFTTTGNGTLRKINGNGTNGSIGLARMVQLLPTPNAREADKYTKKYNPKSQMGTALTAMAMNGMLPTPTARSYKNGSKPGDGRTQRKMEQGWSMELNDLAACNMLPTPTTRDCKASMSPNGMIRKNGKSRNDALSNIPVMIGEHCQQKTGKTSQLNPLFVAEMMGFPLMWTVSPFLSQDGGRNQSKDMETP